MKVALVTIVTQQQSGFYLPYVNKYMFDNMRIVLNSSKLVKNVSSYETL